MGVGGGLGKGAGWRMAERRMAVSCVWVRNKGLTKLWNDVLMSRLASKEVVTELYLLLVPFHAGCYCLPSSSETKNRS